MSIFDTAGSACYSKSSNGYDTLYELDVNFLLKKFKLLPILIVLQILTTPGFELEVFEFKKSKLIVSKWSLITSIADVFTDPFGNSGNGPS